MVIISKFVGLNQCYLFYYITCFLLYSYDRAVAAALPVLRAGGWAKQDGRREKVEQSLCQFMCAGDCHLSVYMFIVVSGATIAVISFTIKIFVFKDEVAFICM